MLGAFAFGILVGLGFRIWIHARLIQRTKQLEDLLSAIIAALKGLDAGRVEALRVDRQAGFKSPLDGTIQ